MYIYNEYYQQRKYLYLTKYLFTIGLGFISIVEVESSSLINGCGYAIILFAIISGVGLLTDRYNVEFIPLWFIAGSLLIIAITFIWAGRWGNSLLALVFMPGLLIRAHELNAISKKADSTIGGP